MIKPNPNEKVCVWICLTLQSQMTCSALTILFWVIYVWLCRDSTDFFSAYLSGRAVYVWLCRDFDFHTEQLSAENRQTFRCIQAGLLCRARSNIFIRERKSNLYSNSQYLMLESWFFMSISVKIQNISRILTWTISN